MKSLPACIRPNARFFTREALRALTVDEINLMMEDHQGHVDTIEWSNAALRAMVWWISLEYNEREELEAWVQLDIQRVEIAAWLKRSRKD
jgi:hypothetical protein